MSPLRLGVGGAALAVVVLVLRELRPVLLPFALAAFLFYLSEPVVRKLAAWSLPRALGITLVLIVGLGALGASLTVVGRAGAALAADAPRYQRALDARLGEREAWVARDLSGRLIPRAINALAGTAAAAGTAALVFAYLAFMLVEAPRAPARWSRAFPRAKDNILAVAGKLERRMIRFVWLQTLVSLGTAVVFWGILTAHGVKLAGFWSMINFVSQFVPNVGPIVSSVPPILALLLEGEPRKAGSLAAFLLVSQAVVGNFVEPKVVGGGVRLDPIAVLLGIVFFGWLWGLAGAFLAVPLLIALQAVCEELPSLRPVAELLRAVERR